MTHSSSSVLPFLLLIGLQGILAADLKCNFVGEDCHNFTTSARQDCFMCKIENSVINDEENAIKFDLSNNPKTANDVERLEITKSTISYIPRNVFETFPELKFMYIIVNEDFENLEPEFFKNGGKLNQFWAWDNDISNVAGNVFVQAPNLQVIGLQSNAVKTIHKNAFARLFKLEVLYLHSNLVKSLDKNTFKDNSKLTFISFASNRLKKLSFSTFAHLISLRNLILSKNACIDETFNSVSGSLEDQLTKLCGNVDPVTDNNLQLQEDLAISKQTRKILEVELLKTKNDIYNLQKFCNIQVQKYNAYKTKNCV